MNFYAFIAFLFTLQAICFFVARNATKKMESQEDYFLAGKTLGFFPLMMTFLATQVGGGLVLGSAEEAFKFGWAVLLYPLGAALGLMVLGVGIGRKLFDLQVNTIAQIFEKKYGSPKLKQIASILSIVSLFLIFTAQIVASSKFMMSLGIENKAWFIACWAIIIIYTALGGLKAVVVTDVIQAAFFVCAFLLCFAYTFLSNDVSLKIFSEAAFDSSGFQFDTAKLCGWLLMPLLFMVIEQDMGQRCFAAKSRSTVTKATLCAAIGTLALCMIPVLFGILAKSLEITPAPGSSILMSFIMVKTSPLIAALVGCAILAAIISTADSLINAIGSNLTQDFDIRLFKKNEVLASQILTIAIACSGILVSFSFSNIVDLMIQSYELSVSCLFVPIFIALFVKKGNFYSACFSMAAGATGFFLFRLVPLPIPKEIATVTLSFLGYGLGGFFVLYCKQKNSHTNTLA